MMHTTLIGVLRPDIQSARNFVCLDTRSREVRHRQVSSDEIFLVIRQYASSAGQEFFIAREDHLGYLYGFTRLLLPQAVYDVSYPGIGPSTALIRELHVYGQVSKIGESDIDKTQHGGLGKQLLYVAEKIALRTGYKELTVISGIGVKGYYAKLGFKRLGTYMSKHLQD